MPKKNTAQMPEVKPVVVIPRERVGQAGLMPAAVKNRNIGQDILLSNSGLGSAVLNNGGEALFTSTLSTTNNDRVMAVYDITLYLASVAAGNEMPSFGGTVDMSQWQVVGGWNDWGATNNLNVKNRLYVRNISAGAAQTVIYYSQARVLVNTQRQANA